MLLARILPSASADLLSVDLVLKSRSLPRPLDLLAGWSSIRLLPDLAEAAGVDGAVGDLTFLLLFDRLGRLLFGS